VGSIIDMSQDQINEHLLMIYNTAPKRVGIYGILKQEKYSKQLKPIYVHSKTMIIDNKIICTGSSNLDNMSFYKSSEINFNIYSEELAKETFDRLIKEHLEDFYEPEMKDDFDMTFDTFSLVARINEESLIKNKTIHGRIVFLVPSDKYQFIVKMVSYPNPLKKMLFKMGWNNEKVIKFFFDNLKYSSVENVNSFFLQSML
jgi:hypothetical protein